MNSGLHPEKPAVGYRHLATSDLTRDSARDLASASALRRSSLTRQGQSRAKLPLGLALTLSSDSGILGDGKTSLASVNLLGLSAPNATITLAGLQTTAAADGRFLFTNLPLPLGHNSLTAIARKGSRSSRFTTQIERVNSDQADAVVTWNAVTLRTLQLDGAASLEATRTLAMTHSAIYRAVKGAISQTSSQTDSPISAEAAVAGAAHQILTQLYPEQRSQLDATLTAALANSSNSTASLLLGQTAADQVLAQRSQDGSDRSLSYQPQPKPGKWRPTPTRFLAAAGVAWAKVVPFVLRQADQFRPGPPPKLTSRTYARDLNQVKRLGQIDSRDRTANQANISRFWIGSAETGSFPGLWNQVAERLASTEAATAESLLQNARRFAQLNLALADAGIAAWDTKYAYWSWRPVTAIRLAGSDHNPATQADSTWQSYLETPAHPDYVSGHSTFSGAAAAVLTQSFGQRQFSVTSLDLPGQSRSFQSFDQAAAAAGMSRIYGGIHTMSANRAGQQLGRRIAHFVLHQFDAMQ